MSPKTSRILEVIVSSSQDAIEAERGGADRLEVVRELEQGGLTPDTALVEEILAKVKIPVRVMLRETASMSVENGAELDVLCRRAAEMSGLGVDGFVMGFISKGEIDLTALKTIATAGNGTRITFHRAFDCVPDPIRSIRALKTVPEVDRILTTGGPGAWPARKLRLQYWQRCAAPEITIMAGVGLQESVIRDLGRDQQIREMHVGRAARIPQEAGGPVNRHKVAQLKGQSA